MLSEVEFKRLKWASRRGMLELDLFLMPFVDGLLQSLPAEQQQQYVELLECEDQEMFNWLMGREEAPEENLRGIVDVIRTFTKTPHAER